MAAPAPLPKLAPPSVPPEPTTPIAPPPSGITIPPSPVGSSNDTAPPLISPAPVPQEPIPPSPAPSPVLSLPLPAPTPSPNAAAPVVPPPVNVSPAPVESTINNSYVPPSAPSPEVHMEPGGVAPVAPPPTASPSPYLPPAQTTNSSTYPPPWWPPHAIPRIPAPQKPRPAFSLPPPRPSNSNQSSTSSVALIVGISAGVAGLFFILGFILLYFCHRKEKNKTKHFEDCESFPKENFYAAEHKILNKKIPVVAHVIPATTKPFSPNFTSNGGNSSSTNSESDNPFSPQARMAAFGFSGATFSYEELAVATNGFSPDNLLGEGGFGYVHRGMLPSGRMIAVKQLKEGSRQGEREFQAEVETISRVHHKHLVSLVGYCMSGAKRLLVYEFVPNGTLEFHLHGKDQPVMPWKTRMKIAKGAAKGLAYLHEDCNPTIIHRDIKATNILLDSKFEAKVSDFGLAKIFSDPDHHISHVSTRVVGTFGYLAPEYAQSGKASDKSDVYSFGVMLLELITGQQPIIETETSMSLVTWARPLLRQAQEDQNHANLVDPHLQGDYDSEELAKMVACAAACVRHSSWLRPRMSLIVRALEGDTSLSDLDDGIRAGQSSISGFLNYDSGEYDMSKFHMIFANGQKGIGR